MSWQFGVTSTVALAVIIDKDQRILVTQRPYHVSHGGYWEFPGGKVHDNESSRDALIREVREEIDLEVVEYQQLGEVRHKYSDREVKLIIFLVTQFTGEAICVEKQLASEWIYLHQFKYKKFPEANKKVLELIENYFA